MFGCADSAAVCDDFQFEGRFGIICFGVVAFANNSDGAKGRWVGLSLNGIDDTAWNSGDSVEGSSSSTRSSPFDQRCQKGLNVLDN